MQGIKIVALLAAAAGLALVYLFLPTDRDLVRRDAEIEEHRPEIEQALDECAELVRWFNERKPTERKKVELADLRARFESLENRKQEYLENDDLEKRERRLGLEQLEDQYYLLLRDSTDLRARLLVMQRYWEHLRVVLSRHGRLKRELGLAQVDSTDARFQQRATELIDQSQKTRPLAEEGLRKMGVSILEGRAVGGAALAELREINQGMLELLESVDWKIPEMPEPLDPAIFENGYQVWDKSETEDGS